jgi:hypothetical protein
VRGLILQTISPGATSTSRRIYPTTQSKYERGKVVTWEWKRGGGWGEAWYRDPQTGAVAYAWTNALEFVGRHLDEVEPLGDAGHP